MEASSHLEKLKAKGAKTDTDKVKKLEQSFSSMKKLLKQIIFAVAKESVQWFNHDFKLTQNSPASESGRRSVELAEDTHRTTELAQQLTQAMKRKPVRRYLIYNEFLKHWINRETDSAPGILAPDQLRREVLVPSPHSLSQASQLPMDRDPMLRVNPKLLGIGIFPESCTEIQNNSFHITYGLLPDTYLIPWRIFCGWEQVWQYSERLACKMTEEAITKINYEPGSVVFNEEDEWHAFFGAAFRSEVAELRARTRWSQLDGGWWQELETH